MELIDAVLKHPWAVQVALASGYAAYILSFTGLRDNHKAIDTAFSTLVFSLIATAILALTASFKEPIISGSAAFMATLIVGLVWRKYVRAWARGFLRATNISWSDEAPSALAGVVTSTKYGITQVAVLLDDGTWLRCDDAAAFSNAPFGPCQIGPNGDIALYLTHEEPAGGPAKELVSVRSQAWGDRLTYVPASRVRKVTLRQLPVR